MSLPILTAADIAPRVDWRDIVAALEKGSRGPIPVLGDQFLKSGEDTLMARAAWIEGLGAGVKSFTVMPGNARTGRPSVQGAMIVFDAETGAPRAVLENDLITWFKTAADSVLGARLLKPGGIAHLLIVGAGTVASSLIEAYRAVIGVERITVWNRSPGRAAALVDRYGVEMATDLALAVDRADAIATATLSREPVVLGEWLRPGQHLDLVGAFRADMREVDDEALTRSRLFVDARETTLHHIGELKIPLAAGVITETDIEGDLRDLVSGRAGRRNADDITLYKNGGGAHLDLMTANALMRIAGI
ncbi:MAG: ornithine cyclodeaminase family protein [Rubricella sp.]